MEQPKKSDKKYYYGYVKKFDTEKYCIDLECYITYLLKTVTQQQISGSADAPPILKTCENCHEYQAGCENYSGKVCERWVESF